MCFVHSKFLSLFVFVEIKSLSPYNDDNNNNNIRARNKSLDCSFWPFSQRDIVRSRGVVKTTRRRSVFDLLVHIYILYIRAQRLVTITNKIFFFFFDSSNNNNNNNKCNVV